MNSNKYENVAEELILIGGSIEKCLKKNGLVLKDGKTNSDFKSAMRKGFDKQRGKFEIEIFNASEEIRKVCKEIKK